MLTNTVLITQARTGSTRLPGKVLKEVEGKSLLKIHLDRLKKCENLSAIVVATTTKGADKIIYNKAIAWGFQAYRGSESDVLDRYYKAATPFDPVWVVRVTSDCPLLDPNLVDQVVAFAKEKDVDYVSNMLSNKPGGFPNGQNVEVFKYSVLKKAWKDSSDKYDREHVTPFIIRNTDFNGGSLFSALSFPGEKEYKQIRMTVDETDDFKLIKMLIQDLGTERSWIDYTEYMIENNLTSINSHVKQKTS